MDKWVEIPKSWGLRLHSGLREIGVESDSALIDQILRHIWAVREESQRINLVSHGDQDFLIERHVLPSLAALPFIEKAPLHAICIGSGAGFPAVDIKIFRPLMTLVMVEATRKKADFLKRVVAELQLKNVDVVWDRAENLAGRQFDLALARGVAPMARLQEIAAPLLVGGGRLIAWKGSRFPQEMRAVKKARFELVTVHQYDPPRVLGILRKL